MGDGRILLKDRRDDSFKKSYRMSLISAGSISLDSTFKPANSCKFLPVFVYFTRDYFYFSNISPKSMTVIMQY